MSKLFNKTKVLKTSKYKEDLPFEKEIKRLPALEKGRGLWQNDFHEFDVYDHTLKFVEYIKQLSEANGLPLDPNIVAAAYLHDIGKMVVAKEKIKNGVLLEKEPGKPYHEFMTHEIVGAQMVKEMSPDFFIRFDLDQEKISKLVGAHYIPLNGLIQMRKTKNYKNFLDKYNELKKILDETKLPRNEVMELFLADSYAKGNSCSDLPELMKVREVIMSGGKEKKMRELYDLQKALYKGKE